MAEPDTKLGENDKALNALQSKISEEQKARLEKAGPLPTEQNQTTPSTPLANPDRSNVIIKNLRTFQGDIAEAIKNQNASVLSIAMAEQAKAGKSNPVKADKVSGPTSFVERIIGKRQEPKPITIPKPLAETIPLKTAQGTPTTLPKPIYQSVLPQEKPKEVLPLPVVKPAPRPIANRIVLSPGKERAQKETAKNALTIAVSILLIILGISTVVGFYFIQKKGAGTIVETPGEVALLRYQSRQMITLSGQNPDELAQTLATIRREQALPEHDILYLALTEQISETPVPITTSRLFSLLKTEIPASLLRAMESEFMLGMYALEGNQPFLLIPLSSFENGFDGMLRWEKTMNQDIGDLFSSRTIPITEYSSTQGTTTATTTRLIYVDSEANAEFEDVTIRNKDTRILKNTRGDTLILYSFLDQNTLLITSSERAFQEILNAFLSGERVR